MKCLICNSERYVFIYGINFKATELCENCVEQIMLQHLNYQIERNRSIRATIEELKENDPS